MSRTESTMETPTQSSLFVWGSESRNRVAQHKLLFSGLFDVCYLLATVESPSGYSLVRGFQFEPAFTLMELVATMSALCDINVEGFCLKSQHGVHRHAVDDRSGCGPRNPLGLLVIRESLHNPDVEGMPRLRDANQGLRSCPLTRIGGVAAAW